VVHFLWQGTLIAAGAALALGLLRDRSAGARYAVACVGLALMLVTPVCTLAVLLSAGGAPRALAVSVAFTEAAALAGWQRLIPLLPWITLVWLVGFSLLQCRTLLHWARAQHMKRHGTRSLSPTWQRHVSDLCDRIGVRRAVRVVESTLADVPMLIGWLSPVILVPTGALCGLTQEQLRAVLAHELAHVRRHDAVVNLFQAAAESLLFFHPAVWWISDRMRVEREYCCDDVAVQTCGDTLCYARALSTLENLRGVPCPALGANGGSLMNRIFRLVGIRRSGRGQGLTPVLSATSLAVLFAAAGLVLASSPDEGTRSEPGPEPRAEASEPAAREPDPQAEDEARIRREIVKRQHELQRLLELEQQRKFDRAAAAEAERSVAGELEQRKLAIEQQRAELSQHLAQMEFERARRLESSSSATEEREAFLQLERAQREEYLAQVYEQRELKHRQQRAEDAQRAARVEFEHGLQAERSSAAAEEREALSLLERSLKRAQAESGADAEALREEIDLLRALEEAEVREREGGATHELERAREYLAEAESGPATEEYLEQVVADREAVIRELKRELDRERLRLEATLRELERLQAAEGKRGTSKKSDKRDLKRDAADEKRELKDLKELQKLKELQEAKEAKEKDKQNKKREPSL
jgi:beta-lactamase regulating signal transducer with metallopeptidase domain